MRSLIIALTLGTQIFVCGLVHAQPDVRAAAQVQGKILVLISPKLDSTLGAAFVAARPASDPEFSHSDINLAALSGDSTILNLLGGFSGLHGLRLQPFIPTHSVAFQDIRERSNPQLFGKSESVVYGSKNNSDLRDAEDKISRWFILSFSDSVSDDRAAELSRKSLFIEQAEPKFVRHLCFTPNDPDISQQYALSLMHCFQAWDIVRCDSTMILADVDNGTDTVEDLVNAFYLNQGEIGIDAYGMDKRWNGIDDDSNGFIDDWRGWDFAGADDYTPDNNPAPGADEPDGSHGTHTAGIMAATGNNLKGIAGVAFGARVIPIKIGCDVCGDLDHGFEGIVYAADMHAKVMNCSWGGPDTYSQAEQDVINYAYAKDCAVVAAAGNNGDDVAYQKFYPASYNHVLSVAITDGNGNTVSLSNYNTQVDISAPGWNVLSTVPGNDYQTMSGTSMGSPNAAGVVALVRQRFPNFTAGQAMEQVRVTGDSIPAISNDQDGTLENDSERLYYEGHGEVDAFRAVTDTNTFSARIDSVTIDDNNGTGSFAPGESGSIILNVRNYLKPLLALKARMEIVQGNSFVTLHQMIVPFGPAATMALVRNDPAALQVSIADSAPPNTQVLIRVFFYDSLVGYAEDYDYFSFTINPSYLDLNKNNLTVTFSSIGTLGYNDVLVNQEGSGFLWRYPPPAIVPYGRSVLYQGGLLAGTDSDHVVDVIESDDPNSADLDFTPEEIVHYVTPPDHVNATQELACSYSDTLADPSIQIGLITRCQAYAFTQGLAANAIVIKYIFRHLNASGITVPDASDSTAVALFTDWDIGPSGLNNITRFDSARQMAMTYRIPPQGFPYIGVKLLSPLPPGASLNYHAIMNDGSQGDLDTYNGLSKANKWTSMTEFSESTGPGDVSHTFGLKNMPMRSQDSIEMTIVIALGEDTATLGQTIDETAALWAAKAKVGLEAPAYAMLEVFPNPFQHALHIAWDEGGPARVTIYDAMGRIVDARMVAGSEYDFTPPSVSSGFYTVDVAVGGTHLRRQVVAEE